MNILCIAQVEDPAAIAMEIEKQSVQPTEVVFMQDTNPAKSSISDRRKKIAENHKLLVEIVKEKKPDFVWQVEQDSVLPSDCLKRLIQRYKDIATQSDNENWGYISGIQIGRHGIYHVGAWNIPNKNAEEFSSVDYRLHEGVKVSATGFYCLLAPVEVWLSGKATWKDEAWGPDVNWGLSIREKGYHIFVDMDLHIGHQTGDRVIWPSDISVCNVIYYRTKDGWKYKTYQ